MFYEPASGWRVWLVVREADKVGDCAGNRDHGRRPIQQSITPVTVWASFIIPAEKNQNKSQKEVFFSLSNRNSFLRGKKQGCQIYVGTIHKNRIDIYLYQMNTKCTKFAYMYQMAVKF
jgi:hypothetical protein